MPAIKDQHRTWIGGGIYSVPEAARFTGVHPRTIRRWIRGYDYRVREELRHSPEVLAADLPQIEGVIALSFRDLIEVRFVDAFRRHGVSWKVLRKAHDEGARVLETTHPFSTRAFRTDGRTIFAEIAQTEEDSKLLDLISGQFAMKKVLEPYLYRGLEISDRDVVVRWWPLERRGRVVLDPERSFGQPIVSREGVPTRVLYQAFQAEESVENVARWFEVSEASVAAAIAFEDQLAA